MKKHKMKWSGNYDGKGRCIRCGMKTKHVGAIGPRGGDATLFKVKGSDTWTTTRPPCAGPL